MKTNCCCGALLTDPAACGCCEGVEILTPLATVNRPGLPVLSYRIGTHATFLETMKARLSSSDFPSLTKLTSREADDPAMALLDAWATVGDVLTFYQERIANEGYLRTATERRSVLELARLVGYRPRPGVAASVYLAYTVEPNYKEETVIPAGSRSQSIPGPGELPQSFETSEDLKARAAWNNLTPRTARPQNIRLTDAQKISKIYVNGTTTNLKPNDPILLIFGDDVGEQVVRFTKELKVNFQSDRTEVTLQEVPFLIIAAVELLRVALSWLDKRLLETAKDSPLPSKFEGVRNALRKVMENLTLGDYPPLHITYFNHGRIYRTLASISQSKNAEEARVHFASLWEQFGRATATFETGSDSSLLQDNKEVVEFAEAVIKILKNPSFKHDLLCLTRYALQQARPTGPQERDTLRALLRLIPPLEVYLKNLPEALSKQLQDESLTILGELVSLLHDRGLRDHFDALLDELLALADDGQCEFLTKVLKWLKTIPRNTAAVPCGPAAPVVTSLGQLIGPLALDPSLQPANSLRLSRDTLRAFSRDADAIPQVLTSLQPRLRESLYLAWANARVQTAAPELKSVHGLRLSAPLFGHNAPVKMGLKLNDDQATSDIKYVSVPDGDWSPEEPNDEQPNRLYLDSAYEGILPGTYMLIRSQSEDGWRSVLARAENATIRPRTAYNLSAKTTQVDLSREWWKGEQDSMDTIRKTIVHVETEKLSLAPEPYSEDVSEDTIDLESLYDGLAGGRWVIVSGERSDIPGTTGVRIAELAMLSSIEQVFDEISPGDRTHTRISLAGKLAYRFKRDTVKIYGNVVVASHGETRTETLGSGDGSKPLQQFTLKQPPLTFVSAPNPSGVDSTLKVYVNDVQWHESNTLFGLRGKDRRFVTKTDDEAKTSVIFGNGREGARLPTGIENVRAVYRNGIGKGGNVKAEQISLLSTRPLGAKEVINPLPASGGADKETRDQARKNAPLAVMALDRLVSVQDYEDFTRVFAGIGKARAVELSDGRRQIVHLTIAGADDIPIETHSDLYRNLTEALRRFGDPYQPFRIELRELKLLVLSALARIHPDYLWEKVEPKIRAALLDVFSFERRELGQDALLSEAISAMQRVTGVEYVDVDTFGGISEKRPDSTGGRRLRTPDEIAKEIQTIVKESSSKGPAHRVSVNLADFEGQVLRPAQLAYLSPLVPATLILNEVPR